MVLLFHQGAVFKGLALFVFLAASYTDYLDGKIARRMGQITPFGRLMDPIADKILTLSAFLGFVQLGIIPAWMAVVIITRDLLITGFRLTLPAGSDVQSARPSGKHKTVVQFASIVGVLIFLTVRETPLWDLAWTLRAHEVIYGSMVFVVAVTLWSGVRYVWKNKHLLGPVRSK